MKEEKREKEEENIKANNVNGDVNTSAHEEISREGKGVFLH